MLDESDYTFEWNLAYVQRNQQVYSDEFGIDNKVAGYQRGVFLFPLSSA